MEDSEIVEMFIQRSEDAIRQLDGRYGGLCRQVSYNILFNRQDMQECVNDTYLKVWESVPPQRPANLKAFVCKLVRCISINRLRFNTRQKRHQEMELLLSEVDECLPSTQDPSQHFDQQQTVELINRWLRTLDNATQLMFVRRYVLMESIPQLAATFALTKSNVSTRLYRARKQLKKYLEKEGVLI